MTILIKICEECKLLHQQKKMYHFGKKPEELPKYAKFPSQENVEKPREVYNKCKMNKTS